MLKPTKETAIAVIQGWLDTWATKDSIRPIDQIRVRGPNTWIDLQDPGGRDERTLINIAADEIRAFMEHRKEFEPAMKWVIAHEYGHHRGCNLDSGLEDPLDWASDAGQDYADAFAHKMDRDNAPRGQRTGSQASSRG